MNDEIENPIEDLSLAPEVEDDLPEQEPKEVIEGFRQVLCIYCNLALLELLGVKEEHIICRCSKCGGLTFIRVKIPDSQIKTEPKVPMGVG